jgi:fibronectin-binding autotransporter adhesin
MKLFLRSAALLLIATVAPFAQAQTISWTGVGPDNNFDNGNNWTTAAGVGTVPGATNLVGIFPGFTTVANTDHSDILVEAGGSPTYTINSAVDHSIEGLLVSSNFDGTNEVGGTLNLNFNGGSTLTVGTLGTAFVGGVTVNFSGNFTQTSAAVEVGSTMNAIDPSQTTGTGTLNLSAGTVNLDGTGTFTVGSVTTGIVNQNAGSVVITGAALDIGQGAAGTGTYTVNTGATLNIGTQGAPAAGTYLVDVGSGTGSNGALNISGGTVNAVNPGSVFLVGDGATGTVNQAGNFTLAGANSGLVVGGGTGTGTYQLTSGDLSMGANGDVVTFDIGSTMGSTGVFNQSGGAVVAGAASNVTIGDAGTGSYTISGGTADFQNGFVLGNAAGSRGTFTQTNGIVTAENVVDVGVLGTGIYAISGGTATFNNGLVVGPNGSVVQTGGTLTVAGGQTLDLTTAGSSYTLSGGTLQVPNNLTGAGTFNFGGGTLQPTAGPFTDSLDGTVNGTSTLDTTNGNITLSGVLTGATGSALSVIGGGAVNLTGANSGSSWGVNILNGTVNASAGTFPSAGAVAIGSNGAGATGTFNLAVSGGTHLFTGNVTSIGNAGTAAFNINFATTGDTLELAGSTNNYSGHTTLAGGGTLRVFNGSFGSLGGNGAVAIGGDPAVATSGTVNLTGTNSYTGLTTVNDGFTLLTNNLSGNLTVTNLGTIGSGLTPATLPAVQATTVNLGGTFTSTGNIILNSNGNTTDLYTVGGASTLSGKVILNGAGTTTNHIFINAPSGLNTAGLTLVTAGSGVLFTGSIQQIGNTEVLTTTQNPTAAFAQTSNERAVSSAIDPILTTNNLPPGIAPLAAALNNLSASQIPGGLEQLTPESLQYARDISFENSTFLAERMNNVCANLRAGYGGLDTSMINVVAPGFDSGMGRSLGSFFAYNDPSFHSAAPNGVNYYPGGESTSSAAINSSAAPAADSPAAAPWDSSRNVINDSPNPYLAHSNPSGSETPRLSEFISGDVVLADLNTNQNTANAPSSKARYTAGDVTAGVSFRMTSHLAAGVLFDYNHTDAKTDSNGSKTLIDSYSPGLFATYYDHGFYANGLFAFGYNNYENKRNVAILGSTASSSPNGQQYVGNLDFGYDFKPAMGWIAGPTLGMTYTHLDIDSFTETGAPGDNLAVQSQGADSFRTRLGGHVGFSTNTGDVLLTPSFTAMWQHEFLDDSSGITSSFNDFNSNPFTIQTAAPSRDSALLGIGLSATLSNSMTLYINYLADVGATNYFAQSVVGGFKARF